MNNDYAAVTKWCLTTITNGVHSIVVSKGYNTKLINRVSDAVQIDLRNRITHNPHDYCGLCQHLHGDPTYCHY